MIAPRIGLAAVLAACLGNSADAEAYPSRLIKMKASMSRLGFEAKIGSPQEFAAFIARRASALGGDREVVRRAVS